MAKRQDDSRPQIGTVRGSQFKQYQVKQQTKSPLTTTPSSTPSSSSSSQPHPPSLRSTPTTTTTQTTTTTRRDSVSQTQHRGSVGVSRPRKESVSQNKRGGDGAQSQQPRKESVSVTVSFSKPQSRRNSQNLTAPPRKNSQSVSAPKNQRRVTIVHETTTPSSPSDQKESTPAHDTDPSSTSTATTASTTTTTTTRTPTPAISTSTSTTKTPSSTTTTTASTHVASKGKNSAASSGSAIKKPTVSAHRQSTLRGTSTVTKTTSPAPRQQRGSVTLGKQFLPANSRLKKETVSRSNVEKLTNAFKPQNNHNNNNNNNMSTATQRSTAQSNNKVAAQVSNIDPQSPQESKDIPQEFNIDSQPQESTEVPQESNIDSQESSVTLRESKVSQATAATLQKRGSIPRVTSSQLPAVERQSSLVLEENNVVSTETEDPIAQLRKLLDTNSENTNGITPPHSASEPRDAPSVSNSRIFELTKTDGIEAQLEFSVNNNYYCQF